MKRLFKILAVVILSTVMTVPTIADNSAQVYNTLNNQSYLESIVPTQWGDKQKFAVMDINGDGNYEMLLSRDWQGYSAAIQNVHLIVFKNESPVEVDGAHIFHGYNPSTHIYAVSAGWTGSIVYQIKKLNSDGSTSIIHTINAEYNTSVYPNKYAYTLDGGSPNYYSGDKQLENQVYSILDYYELQEPTYYDCTSANIAKFKGNTNAYNSNSSNEIVKVYLNGNLLNFSSNDAQPQIINNRTYVPIRATCDALGIVINWNSQANQLTFTRGNTTVTHTMYSNIVYVNGQKEVYGTTSINIGNRTMMPIRMLADALGIAVEWNYDTRNLYITTQVSDIVMTASDIVKINSVSATPNIVSANEATLITVNASIATEKIKLTNAVTGEDILECSEYMEYTLNGTAIRQFETKISCDNNSNSSTVFKVSAIPGTINNGYLNSSDVTKTVDIFIAGNE